MTDMDTQDIKQFGILAFILAIFGFAVVFMNSKPEENTIPNITTGANVSSPQIIGNSIRYFNEWGEISVFPHTLNDIRNTVYINVTSNLTGTQYIDSYFGFNPPDARPTSVSTWVLNVSHTVPDYGNLLSLQTVVCDGTSAGIINNTHVWCYYASNATNKTLDCPSPRFFPTSMSCQYNQTYYGQTGQHLEYWDDWVDVGPSFKVADYGGITYYYVENVSFTQGQKRQLKATIEVKPNTNGKYDILMKRTSDSIQSAFLDKTVPAVILDPWWNATWGYKKLIQINSTTATTLNFFPVRMTVDTNALITAGKMNETCKDLRVVDSTELLLLPYEIENNTCNTTATIVWFSVNLTNGIGTGMANTTAYFYYGSNTVADAQDPHTLWNQSGYIRVYHFGETTLGNSAHKAVEDSSQYADHAMTGSAAPTPFLNTSSKFGYSLFYGVTRNVAGKYVNFTNVYLFTKAAGTFEGWYYDWLPGSATIAGFLSSYAVVSPPYGTGAATYADTTKTISFSRDGYGTRLQAVGVCSNTWTLYNFMNNGTTTGSIYVNGTLKSSGNTGTAIDGSPRFAIGADVFERADTASWAGYIDEFRISTDTKTADWAKAEYGMLVSMEAEQGASSNTIPIASSVVLLNNSAGTTLGTPFKNNPTNFNASGNCSDVENATLKGVFNFYLNNTFLINYTTYNWVANQTNYTNASVGGLNKSDSLTVGLICYDGGLWGNQTNGTTITVNNTAPTVAVPSLNSTTPKKADVLLCVNGSYNDGDSDTIGLGRWRWWFNGTVIGGQTAQSLDLAAIGANETDRINCSYKTEDSGYSTKNSTEMFSTQAVVSSVCGTITVDTILFNNLASTDLTCITIGADNITLNCNGYNITGNTSIGAYGINTTGTRNNITIKNCNIKNHERSIYILTTTNSMITNVTFTNVSQYGVFLSSSSGIITTNVTSTNVYYSLALGSASNNIFNNITMANGTFGIGMYGESLGYNNTFANSTVTNMSSKDIELDLNSQNSVFLNVSFNASKVSFVTCTPCNFTVKWYGRVNVTNTTAALAASVNVSDKNGKSLFATTAGAGGLTTWITITDYYANNTANYTLNNHTINASFANYVQNTTTFNFSSRDLTVNLTLYASAVNTAPTASLVVLLNNSAGTTLGTPYKNNPANFNASGNCSDLENNTMTGNFTFYLNGTKLASYLRYNWVVNQTNYTNTSTSGLNKSDSLKVGLSCYDSSQWGIEVNSTGITVNNTAPTQAASVVTSNDTGYFNTSILTCANGTFSDADGDARNATAYWRWFLNNTTVLPEHTGVLNLTLRKINVTDMINCSVIVNDTGYSMKSAPEAFSSQITIVNYTAPGAYGSLQSVLYYMDNYTRWAHYATTSVGKCGFEFYPTNNKTTVDISFKIIRPDGSYAVGDSSTWVVGTRRSDDWNVWESPSFTPNQMGNWRCQGYAEQSDLVNYYTNGTFQIISTTATPSCLWKANCTMTLSGSVSYNISHQYLKISSGTTLTLPSQATQITTQEEFDNYGTIDASGSSGAPGRNITITSRNMTSTGNIFFYGGSAGLFSGAGGSGGNLKFINTSFVNNTGLIYGYGGSSGQGSAGAKGGTINTTATGEFSSTGTINLDGGLGGSCGAYPGVAGVGGTGGNVSIDAMKLTLGPISAVGGRGGTTCSYVGGCPGDGGAGTRSYYFGRNYTKAAAAITNAGGVHGEDSPSCGGSPSNGAVGTHYVYNSSTVVTANNFDQTPTYTAISKVDFTAPGAPTIVLPAANTAYTTLTNNITFTWTAISGLTYEVKLSNNRTFYYQSRIFNASLPATVYPNETSGSLSINLHRMVIDNNSLIWIRAYNATNLQFGAWASVYVNVTTINETLVAWKNPLGASLIPQTVEFWCNYTKDDGTTTYSATSYVYINNIRYNASYIPGTGNYLYNASGDNMPLPGEYNWYCYLSKADYTTRNTSGASFNSTGFGIYYPSGISTFKFTCPYSTIYNVTPYGQKAGIGIFRIRNFNTTNVKNYTMWVNASPVVPFGINFYASENNTRSTSTLLTVNAPKILNRINGTNHTLASGAQTTGYAYIWVWIDCVGAPANPSGFTMKFGFREQDT